MKSAKRIQKELEKRRNRRSELKQEKEAAEKALEEAQADVIDGKDGAQDRATEAKARALSLESSIEQLNQMIGELEADLAEAKRREQLQDLKTRLKEEAKAASKAQATYEKLLTEASEVLQQKVEKAHKALTRWSRATDDFARLTNEANQLAGHESGTSDSPLVKEIADEVDLQAIRYKSSRQQPITRGGDRYTPPELPPAGSFVRQAIDAKSRREFNKEREERRKARQD